MAIGAYSSTFATVYCTQGLERWLTGVVGADVAAAIVFTLVILVGALAAAIAGLVVEFPASSARRLSGHCHAWLCEIIRIVIVNTNKVGGATGFRGCVIQLMASLVLMNPWAD